MSWYWEGSKSWCSATPTVRIRANTSKPSNVHPRFEATSAFHWDRLSERYHGEDGKAPNSLISSPPQATCSRRPDGRSRMKLTLISRVLGRGRDASASSGDVMTTEKRL